MRRLDFRGFSVVITGGSRGLGLEIARQFTREGARVTLLARDGDELSRAELAKDRVLVTTVIPGLVAFGTGMAARLLPAPAPASEHARHTGHESTSKLAPSLLTKPSDSMIPVNNEE
ncbi:SDR family NAD(P)-dependent oxidoreductase [Geomonas sp. Red32]|uniref:SDR family NAD(P)-dependent oxidoreductase n=1 Tax=Geomonas sp. Red32 TaxID=2912856 RepID=UPI00202CFB3E|nr:SDR family NAD(P)-dependent oxidoreductase [Geomonas sp. Red32]MCM0080748.1 SDR family NAD(P)-dependent oxidoreductase [Geomonas sp. Red32]